MTISSRLVKRTLHQTHASVTLGGLFPLLSLESPNSKSKSCPCSHRCRLYGRGFCSKRSRITLANALSPHTGAGLLAHIRQEEPTERIGRLLGAASHGMVRRFGAMAGNRPTLDPRWNCGRRHRGSQGMNHPQGARP